MARPQPKPAPVPEDDDDFPVGQGPAPAKAPNKHPVTPRTEDATKVPSHQGGSGGTKETARQGAEVAESQGGKVASALREEAPQDSYAGRMKIGTRVTRELKRRLKIASAVSDRTEESIVVEAIEQWLERNNL
jgi:hypothetical protein